jgi:TRAP transporter TAXI family solute receptor
MTTVPTDTAPLNRDRRRHVTAAALALAVLALGPVLPAEAQTLRMGAGQQGSQNYGVNTALAQAIEDRTELSVTVQSFGGPVAYLPLLATGELDMAAVVTPDYGDALRGTGPFAGLAQESLAVIAPLLPSVVGLMVRADSGIAAIPDLAGRRVAWGIPAQASLQPYVEGALANGGLAPGDVTQVPVASVAAGVAALVDGSVDATLFALRGGAVVEANQATGGIRWLPFDSSDAAVARMQAVAPEAYLLTVVPAEGLVGIEAPIATMTYDYILAARADLDDAVVEQVARMLADQAAEIAAGASVLSGMTAETVGRPYPGLAFHPAAAAVLHGGD